MADLRPMIIPMVVRTHVENAAFFWAQRDTLTSEDEPDAEVLAFLDDRLESNLDGLRIAGAAAWPFIIDAYETFPEKGELFVIAHRALESGDMKRLDQAAAFARSAEDGARGLCGAFVWLPPEVTAPVVRKWIDSHDSIRTEAALAAMVAHGGHPGDRIDRLMRDASDNVREMAAILAARDGRSRPTKSGPAA